MRPMLRSSSLLVPALVAVAALGALESQAKAAPFTVTNNGDLPDMAPGNGICGTAMGFCSLRAAVMEANALAGANTITIPAGTGMISLNNVGALENAAATGDLDITSDITIVGNGVVIDGVSSDRIFHVLTGATADISGVTLQHGWGDLVGGAIYNQGDLTLSSCTVTQNAASHEGGGIKNITPGVMTVSACEIFDNEADWGGGIYSNTDLVLADSNLYFNTAGRHGGGLFTDAPADVTNTYFAGNIAGERGGGVATFDTVSLTDCTLELNIAGTYGGGLYMYTEGAVVDAFRTDFIGNVATDGGGIQNFWGDLTLRQVGMWDNMASADGGGIDNQGIMLVKRSAIYSNSAVTGAGIHNYGFNADATVENTTISGNAATGAGGGVYSSVLIDFNNVTIANNTGTVGGLSAAGTTTMTNTIVGDNLDLAGAASDCVGSITSNGYDVIESIAGCVIAGPATANTYGVGPGLGALAYNGGRTPTHALLAGSPARNTGNNATCLAADQRGTSRPLGGTCDRGAYERN